MNVIDTLERRFGRYAIPGLVRMIVALNALVFVLGKLNPAFWSSLMLDPAAVRHGQYWRLITYIFVPSTDSYVWILFALGFLWMIGDGLERSWGAFRLNLFYLIGMVGTTVAAVFFGGAFSNQMLNLSLLFAFAWFYPDVQIYVLFIIPVQIKWFAWFLAATLLFGFANGSAEYDMAVLVSLANYLIFFGPQIVEAAIQRRRVTERRQKFAATSIPEDEPLHRCTVCRRSDVTHPDLDFRVGRDGNDYCVEHLPKPPAP